MPDITRRDFLDGIALAVAAGLAPSTRLMAADGRNPPVLAGMRGHHDGSFETAHRMRDGDLPSFDAVPVEERYDLVVVGAGISGLAAAHFYRRRQPDARILVLDNHDDFGGHAKRNEFMLNGRLFLSYGGSESLQSPRGLFSDVAKGLMGDLGVDIGRFETAFERDLYPSLGLSRGVFLPGEFFGKDTLVTGDPTSMVADDIGPARANAKSVRDFAAGFPLSEADKAALVALYEGKSDPLPGRSREEKLSLLETTSYREYLIGHCGCSEAVANCFHGRSLDFLALASDLVSAAAAREIGLPGFSGLGLPLDPSPEREEPYIYHFPDGNASLARLLVRALVPEAADGGTMDDILLARFRYDKLDRPGQNVRVRLDSTCVQVRDAGEMAELVYMRAGQAHRVRAKHAVLACFNMAIPYMMPDLPEEQRNALLRNVKAPLVYTKVLVRDWKAWADLGVHEISAPMSFHCRLKLDYPVSMGGYRHSRRPDEPMCLHLVHVPNESNPGMEARDQFRIGRMQLLERTFDDFEARIRDDLDRMLGPGGFASGRDIAAITVNRWSHGYSYGFNSLFDGPDANAAIENARRPAGRIAIANSDADWHAYAHTAIDQAHRAVDELS